MGCIFSTLDNYVCPASHSNVGDLRGFVVLLRTRIYTACMHVPPRWRVKY